MLSAQINIPRQCKTTKLHAPTSTHYWQLLSIVVICVNWQGTGYNTKTQHTPIWNWLRRENYHHRDEQNFQQKAVSLNALVKWVRNKWNKYTRAFAMLQKQKPQCPNEDLKWLEKSNMKLYQKCNASYYLAIDGGVTRYKYKRRNVGLPHWLLWNWRQQN